MTKLGDEKPQDSSIPTATPEQGPNASQLLQEFLSANNIELRLTPPNARLVDGGGVLIEQPQVVAQFRVTNSIKKN